MKRFSHIFLICLILTVFSSCRDSEEAVPAAGTFEKYEYNFTRSSGVLKLFVKEVTANIPTENVKYDVDAYTVTYYTTYKNRIIPASGRVFIPKAKEDEISFLSFQHGTIASNAEAPSQLASDDYELLFYAALASTGFVTMVPDYIGFGASAGIMHPYYVEDFTAGAIVDNIAAARAVVTELGLQVSSRLYLAGYSQGGYATMVTHKYLEEQQSDDDLELVASFPAAGGYDIKGVQKFFFEQENYSQPFYIAYVAQAYRVSHDWDGDLSIFFNEPYASAIPGYFDGSMSGSQINAKLTTDVDKLLNTNYLQNVDTDPIYEEANDAFSENSPLNWKPKTRMHMFHGDADITVPYQNSVEVYDHFISMGVSQDLVGFTTLEGKTHGTGFLPYAEIFMTEMLDLEAARK